jgi:hypothetical protein
VPSLRKRRKLPTWMTPPTKKTVQTNKSTVSAKLPNLPAAKPRNIFNTFTKLNGKLQLIQTIDLGMKISTRSGKFKENLKKEKFNKKLEIETKILTPRTKFLKSKSVQRHQGPLNKIKLKKTGLFIPEDRKQEKQEEGRSSSSINLVSSQYQERKQKKQELSPQGAKSTKSLVNIFENNISSAEQIQILGGRSQINSSDISKFKAGKQPNLED